MHIHLDPVGGIAGDMFTAAMLDTFPEWTPDLIEDFRTAGLERIANIALNPHTDGILDGKRFEVKPAAPATDHHGHTKDHAHEHRHLNEIQTLIDDSGLVKSVRVRAQAIFLALGEAEAAVHGKPLEAVSFHEVGAWDSIADVLCAAWLIERAAASSWSCATLPLGRGRTPPGAHGALPVPAPATARLLEGFPMAHLDDAVGERITPTGAAILKHLAPSFEASSETRTLARSGIGFGTRRFEGFSNVLRVLVFEQAAREQTALGHEQVAEIRFEVDDQSPEDLAIGLRAIRISDGVLDVHQSTVFGKKGRMGAQIQVLVRPEHLDAIVATCLLETTTLGVRWQMVQRSVLARERGTIATSGGAVRVKTAVRPDGTRTSKPELDDIAAVASTQAGRSQLRHEVQTRQSDAEPHD